MDILPGLKGAAYARNLCLLHDAGENGPKDPHLPDARSITSAMSEGTGEENSKYSALAG